MVHKKIKLLVFGKVPPPFGGVTVFISNIVKAAKFSSVVDVSLFSWRSFFSIYFDVAVINASNVKKRFLQVLFARLLARKVCFVIHGNHFDFCFFNRMSLWLCTSVFCLNESVKRTLDERLISNLKISTVFKQNTIEYQDGEKANIYRDNKKIKRILFYANNNSFIDGKEIYGAGFFLSYLKNCPPRIDVKYIVVDLSGAYKNNFSNYDSVEYYSNPVDFRFFLKNSDLYIRPTSTDGMSVAVIESLLLGVPCLASDAVERPAGVVVYRDGDLEDFSLKVNGIIDGSIAVQYVLDLTDLDDFATFAFCG